MKKEIFLADENFDYRIVKLLREDGHKIYAVHEMDSGISDEKVIQLSNELEAIILTGDKDFGELTYRLNLKSHGIVLVRMSGVPFDKKQQIIIRVINSHLNELRNSFSVISEKNLRIKSL